jgi:hypothetical protein
MPALFSFAAPDCLALRGPPHERSLSVRYSRNGRRASPSRVFLTAINRFAAVAIFRLHGIGADSRGAALVVAFKPGPGQTMRRVFNPTTQGTFGVGPPTESNINTLAGGAEGIRTIDDIGALSAIRARCGAPLRRPSTRRSECEWLHRRGPNRPAAGGRRRRIP